MIGQRFGRWTVVGDAPRQGRDIMFECRCECGTMKQIRGTNLRHGSSKSCGCLSSDTTAARNTRHNKSKTRLYHVWGSMISRCENPNIPAYKNYGGRGITVCESWRKDYAQFEADMGVPSTTSQLDRRDNNKGYSKENCRWVTPRENARNTRRNINVTFMDECKTLAEWADTVDIKYFTLLRRLEKGWDVDRAMTEVPFIGKNQTYAREVKF